MATGICQLCENRRNLVRAHVVPRSFWNFGSEPLAIFSSDENSRPQKSQIGVYDERILCADCDSEFGRFDEYVLLNLVRTAGVVNVDEAGIKCVQYQGIDVKVLQKFAISVAWRASKSKHEYFRNVNLGPYENIFFDLLKSDARSSIQFDIFVTEFDKRDAPFISPTSVRFGQVNMLRIPANRFVFYVKVDQRQTPEEPRICAVRDNDPVLSIVQSWDDSSEKKLVLKMIARKNRPKFWK